MVLKAFFDDSGKLSNPEETVAVVGGCIATVAEWDKLEPEWFAVCAYKVNEFHARDFAHSQGDFVGWSEDKRKAFLSDLTLVIDRHLRNPSKPLGAALPLSQFQLLPLEKQAEWGGDPYFVCLQDCIRMAAVHAHPPSKMITARMPVSVQKSIGLRPNQMAGDSRRLLAGAASPSLVLKMPACRA